MARLKTASAMRIELDIEDPQLRDEVRRILGERGLGVDSAAPQRRAPLRACAPTAFEPSAAAALGELALDRAEQRLPLCVLAPPRPRRAHAAQIWAACVAHLRARGALVESDPDVWLEALALIAQFGLPSGPVVAIVAPPGSVLARSAAALAAEAERLGERPPTLAVGTDELAPTDVVLAEPGSAPAGGRRPLVVPVASRAELMGDGPSLVGLRAAVAATIACGRLASRLEDGLEVAPRPTEIDRDRFDRQLARLGERAGDHETKVLLAACGVAITRQAVATTPSAATRIAKRAGYPVEVKPWGSHVPGEREGCPLEVDIRTAAEVRRAFSQMTAAGDTEAVIVRGTPPAGRELAATIRREGALGVIIHIEIDGVPAPMALPVPCAAADAAELLDHLAATRKDDDPPHREALLDLLTRAGALVAETDRIEELRLPRVVVGADRADVLVIDAGATLRPA